MGIDISLYRVRVGMFRGGKGYRPKVNKQLYNPHSLSDDVHYRSFVTFTVILLILCGSWLTLEMHQLGIQALTNLSTCDTSFDLQPANFSHHYPFPSTDPECCSNPAYTFSSTMLLLSGDVELNPGPGPHPGLIPTQNMDTQQILEAINQSSMHMSYQLDQVRNEVAGVRSEVVAVRSELSQVKQKIASIESKQISFDNKVGDLEQNFDHVKYLAELNNSDMAELSMSYEQKCRKIEMLEKQINYMQADGLKNNLRVFGLKEVENETSEILIDNLVKNVWKVAESVRSSNDPPDEDTTAEESLEEGTNNCPIESAKRVGTARDGATRMVLVKLKSVDSKMKVFKARDVLRVSGIRVSSDHTYMQREQLKELSRQGRAGYFKNGELHIRPTRIQNDIVPERERRIFRQGVRRIQTQNGGEMETMNGDLEHTPDI